MANLWELLQGLAADVRRNRPLAGSGLRAAAGPTGTVLSLASGAGGAGGGQVVPVKLTARTDSTTYTGDVYGAGIDSAATETGVTVRVLRIAASETLPFAKAYPAWRQVWSGGMYWTIQPPVWDGST